MNFSGVPLKPNSQLAIVRSGLVALIVLALVGILGVGLAHGKKKKTKAPPPPPKDLPGHVGYLAWQLRGVHLDDSGPLTSQIQKRVVDHLEQWLADSLRPTSSVEVRRELENVFSKLRYPTFAQPAVFAQPWKGAVLIGAGYTLGWTEYDRVNVVALFESREGKTGLVGLISFAPRADLHYEFLESGGSEAFKFFIYGTRLGKSHPRLTTILYAFDGQELKPLWEARDLYDGKMDVGQERVVIRYLKEDEYIREVAHKRKPPRHEASYKITPQGLELETDREIPF